MITTSLSESEATLDEDSAEDASNESSREAEVGFAVILLVVCTAGQWRIFS